MIFNIVEKVLIFSIFELQINGKFYMYYSTGFIQKIATIFQGLLKDHIRFSRTTS